MPNELLGFVLPDVALAAQTALSRRQRQMLLVTAIGAMAASATYPTVKEPYTIVDGQRGLEPITIGQCLSCIIHAYRMVGHILPAAPFLRSAFVIPGNHHRDVVVATEASIGFEVNSRIGLSVVF